MFAAILWVGSTYYFTWLDGQMRRLEARSDGKGGAVWMVHSGGFYTVVKQKTLGVPPGEVHWFRYEALATFVSGFVLLNLVYYHGGLMVDPIDPRVDADRRRALIGIGTLRHRLDRLRPAASARRSSGTIRRSRALGFVLIIAVASGLSPLLSTPRHLHPHRRAVRHDHGAPTSGCASCRRSGG